MLVRICVYICTNTHRYLPVKIHIFDLVDFPLSSFDIEITWINFIFIVIIIRNNFKYNSNINTIYISLEAINYEEKGNIRRWKQNQYKQVSIQGEKNSSIAKPRLEVIYINTLVKTKIKNLTVSITVPTCTLRMMFNNAYLMLSFRCKYSVRYFKIKNTLKLTRSRSHCSSVCTNLIKPYKTFI